MQARGEERDRDAGFREVVVVAAIENALAVRLWAQIVVRRVRLGGVVKMVQRELLIAAVDRFDSLFQIVAADLRTYQKNLARVGENVGFIGVGEPRALGAADHVHIKIGDDFVDIDRGVLVKILRSPETLFFSRVPQEDDGAFGADTFGRAFGIGMGHGEHTGGTGAVVIRAIVNIVAVGQRRAETDVIEVRADDNVFLSLIHISEPTRQAEISYAVFCLKKK